jgi:hypothetical protein
MSATDSTPTTSPTDSPVDTTAIDTYLSAWNEPDDAKRAELVAASMGADLWYRDPMLEADGLEAFTAVLGGVQGQLPGHVMRRTSAVDVHHDVARFNWAFGVPGEAPTFAGVDLVKFDAEGKLHRVVGFAPEHLERA